MNQMSTVLAALSAACMVAAIVLLMVDIYITWQDRKERKKENEK